MRPFHRPCASRATSIDTPKHPALGADVRGWLALLAVPVNAAVAASLLLSILLTGTLRAEPAQGRVEEHWYVIELAGKKAGFLQSRRTVSDTQISSDTAMSIAMKRGPMDLKIGMDSGFIETPDGKPISMRTKQTLGTVPVEQSYKFNADGIVAVSRQGQTESTRTLLLPDGKWFTPFAAEQEFKKRFKAGEREVTLRTIDPSSSATPIDVTRKLVGPARVMSRGREIDASEYSIATSIAPGIVMKEISDAEGLMLRSETSIGGIAMTLVLATEAEAKGKTDAPELLISSFVKPDRPIFEPRSLDWAIYEVFVDEGDMPSLPAGGSQRVGRQNARVYRVVIDATSQNIAPDDEIKDPRFLAASSVADTRDELIRKLAENALKDAGPDKNARAEQLRRFVYKHISKKDLGVGFGTASETARSKTGDCTEHAVLLATLLRIEGIPSRVVSGVVYADQFAGQQEIFGYHMWTQAVLTIDGYPKWVDLDAALSETRAFDATHIAFATTDLSDEAGIPALTQLVSLLGRVKIIVVETSSDERQGK